MKNTTKQINIIIGLVFIWIGFVGAISFMEAWLKFQAPGITTELGLGIGKLIFAALNKMEIAFSSLILGVLILYENARKRLFTIILLIPIVILVIQSLWLLPELNERADQIINKQAVPASKIHFVYVALETVKILSLFVFGFKLFTIKTDEK